MSRRLLVFLILLCVVTTGFTADMATLSLQAKGPSVVQDGWTPLPLGEKKPGCDPVANPKAVPGSIIPASDPIDASSFSRPAHVNAIELRGNGDYVVVTIDIARADWPSFAAQLNFGDNEPEVVGIAGDTLRCLIDLDKVAEEFIQSRKERGESPVDIRDMESYFDLVVYDR